MSDLLSIGSSGIGAYQRALATVSNNIANTATDGYSRQDVTIASNQPTLVGTGYLGTGARFDSVRRQYDAFIEANLRNSNSELKGQEPLVSYVNRLIDIMGDDSIGLTSAMNQFFESSRNLASDPASTVQRSSFLRDADGVAARFQQLSGQMELLDTETRQAIQTDVGKINSLTAQLAEVNRQAAKHADVNKQPAELLDQRDKLLRDLSSLTTIKTSFGDNGSVLVSVGDVISQGVLVDGNKFREIGLSNAKGLEPNKLQFVIDPYGETESLPNLVSGSIGGTLAFREQVLNPAREVLDSLAQKVATEVNRIHRSGIDAEGRLGGDLFSFDASASGAASGIRLAITDGSRVAAAAQFRVIDDPLNAGIAQPTIAYADPSFSGPTGLYAGLADGQWPQVASETFSLGSTQTIASLGVAKLGMQDLVLALQQPASGQSLQVFTRDGRHLLGTTLSSDQKAFVMRSAAGMEAGATYSSAYLNKGEFLGMDLFMGARAAVQKVQQFDPTSGKPADPLLSPAVLQGAALSGNLDSPIQANTYKLNGVSLGELSDTDGSLSADDIADWLNGYSSQTGVTASVVDGAIRLSRPTGNTTDDIRLTVGANGEASDLAALGFDSAVYLDGQAQDDLLVFVTDDATVESSLTVTSQFTAIEGDAKQTLRSQQLQVKFTDASNYQIIDATSKAVLAERQYDADAARISYRGLTVSLSASPSAGDSFMIDANADGIGNNEALLDLVALEDAKIMPGGLTLTEAYIERVNQVGNIAQQASVSRDALEVVYNQAQEARDGIAGVSLDEEAAALVRFQQAYQANAKVMQVASTLFDAILQVN